MNIYNIVTLMLSKSITYNIFCSLDSVSRCLESALSSLESDLSSLDSGIIKFGIRNSMSGLRVDNVDKFHCL